MSQRNLLYQDRDHIERVLELFSTFDQGEIDQSSFTKKLNALDTLPDEILLNNLATLSLVRAAILEDGCADDLREDQEIRRYPISFVHGLNLVNLWIHVMRSSEHPDQVVRHVIPLLSALGRKQHLCHHSLINFFIW